MQFTVQSGTPVHSAPRCPVAVPGQAVADRQRADTDQGLRVLSFCATRWDLRRSTRADCNKRSIDGPEFTTPTTEFAADRIDRGVGPDQHDRAAIRDDPDLQLHQIHIHLLEFQLINRQAFN